jgi:hypothetical protein
MKSSSYIIYTSRSQAEADEFWWSEGLLTATKGGDAIIFGVVTFAIILLGAWMYGKVSK